MIQYADVIVDLQAGDTGKGKVCNTLSQIPNEYTHVVRYNGGGNAGHTIYKKGKKMVTHFIPSGIVNGVKSIIGPGCVVNPIKLLQEIKQLEHSGIEVVGNLFIDKRVHIITAEHIDRDSTDTKIGTTKTGNGPCYSDKYTRSGNRAENAEILESFVIDIYEELHNKTNSKILFEGAQGFELDVDWGDYPYVTSSHCTVGSAVLNGVPPQKIRKVYGVCKAYNTYVGAKEFEKHSKIFDKIREVGNEYGSTTGRPRQIGWTNLDDVIKAANINGVTHMVVNKVDVLEKVGTFKVIHKGQEVNFVDKDFFKVFFDSAIKRYCPLIREVIFSESMDTI
jgi:adenylosuccinate synthase